LYVIDSRIIDTEKIIPHPGNQEESDPRSATLLAHDVIPQKSTSALFGIWNFTGRFSINHKVPVFGNQCCGSGMFYSGSGSDHCSIPDPDPGVKKHRIPDTTYFCIKAINKFGLLHPESRIRGVKKHRIRNTGGNNQSVSR
jgi:hypothetical protein